METYVVKFEPPRLRLKQRAIAALGAAGLYFVIIFCWSYFWPTDAEKHSGLSSVLVKCLVMALIWGVAMSFLIPLYRRPGYTVVVEGETITGVWGSPRLKWLATAVRKDKIRTIWEFEGKLGLPDGILISEHAGLGARMRGRVYLPATLPDYEYLKRLAESWRFQETSEY